jgi:hypothetical protein
MTASTMSGDLLGEPKGVRTTTEKWFIGAFALALIAGLAVGLGVGMGLQAKVRWLAAHTRGRLARAFTSHCCCMRASR